MYELVDRKCPSCGKIFVPAPYHVFKLGDRYYCCWTCYLKAKRKAERRRRNHRGGNPPRAVNQYALDGTYIATYPSIREAVRGTGNAESTILKCLREDRATRKYIFKYAEEGVKNERTDETDTERENT